MDNDYLFVSVLTVQRHGCGFLSISTSKQWNSCFRS